MCLRAHERVQSLPVSLRIDDHQVGVGVFVLHRPQLVRVGVHLQPVVVSLHHVDVLRGAVKAVLHNLV